MVGWEAALGEKPRPSESFPRNLRNQQLIPDFQCALETQPPSAAVLPWRGSEALPGGAGAVMCCVVMSPVLTLADTDCDILYSNHVINV